MAGVPTNVDASVISVFESVEAFVSLDWPTEISLDYGDYSECRCKIHTPVVCGVVGGVGCAAKKPGTLPPIAVLYDAKVSNRMCHADERVRRVDADLARAAMTKGVLVHSYGLANKNTPYDNLHSVKVTDTKVFGAGYCYQDPVRGTARVRAARVLGGDPLVIDFLRVFRVVGNCKFKPVRLVEVSEHVYHVQKDQSRKGVSESAGVEFVTSLVKAVEKSNGTARIGASEYVEVQGDASDDGSVVSCEDVSVGFERMNLVRQLGPDVIYREPAGFRDTASGSDDSNAVLERNRLVAIKYWLGQAGVVWPEGKDRELALASSALAAIPVLDEEGRVKNKLYASIGLDTINLNASKAVISRSWGKPEHVDRLKQSYSAKLFWKGTSSEGLWGMFAVGPVRWETKAARVMVETFMGAVCMHCGPTAVEKAMSKFGNGVEKRMNELLGSRL